MPKVLQLFRHRQNPGSQATGFGIGKQEMLKNPLRALTMDGHPNRLPVCE
jgi:hypothetical protein